MRTLKENKKGITLVSLVITIIVLLILASIATYSGINVINSSKLTTFTTELKIMQTQVNELYQKSKNGEQVQIYNEQKEISNLGENLDSCSVSIQSQANLVFKEETSGITDSTDYRYWSNDLIKELGIEGVEQDFFVNLETRSVVSYEGFQYEGKTYYTLNQLPDGLYNVEYKENTATPIFDAIVEEISENKWKISITNIQYEGYIDKWDVNYQLEGQNYKSEDLSFVVTQKGDYIISISNGNVESNSITVKVLTTVEMAQKMNKVFDDNMKLIDMYQNQLTIPKGFKIAEDSATDVTGGVVIEDATYDGTKGSQFVWIPVGDIKSAEGNTNITLGRYVFDSSGNIDTTLSVTNPNDQLKTSLSSSYYYTEGLKDETTSNTHAIDIESFITSVNDNYGYYIGRYEARKSLEGNLTVIGTDSVYNNITQPDAAVASRKMYTSDKFTSDLMNSYAWDTAVMFEQKFDDRITDKTEPYSRQNSLNAELISMGTNSLKDITMQDKICNIWDMASNYYEWTTETSSNGDRSCVHRGGAYNSRDVSYTSFRYTYSTTAEHTVGSFRPILYL